jgi:hypothetical protein
MFQRQTKKKNSLTAKSLKKEKEESYEQNFTLFSQIKKPLVKTERVIA